MKNVTRMMFLAVIVASLGSSAMAVDIQTVPVGNAGNLADSTGYGAVSYAYNIGKYEVTAGQYRDFLNAVDPNGANPYGLYNASMNSDSYGCQITWNSGSGVYDFSGRPSGSEGSWMNRPVNYVSWGDAARFSNWLHNGQPTGTLTGAPAQDAGLTEDGSYDLNGAMTDVALQAVARKSDATWAITSEDEWYKAAYYTTDFDKNGAHDDPGYYDYPTSSNAAPSNNLDGGGNNATFDDGDYTVGSPYWRTWGGAHSWSESPYGTFDQGGNVWEWNEAIISGSYRGLRGGSFNDGTGYSLLASTRGFYDPSFEGSGFGFRVSEVPEPATMAILALGGIGMLRRRKCVRR